MAEKEEPGKSLFRCCFSLTVVSLLDRGRSSEEPQGQVGVAGGQAAQPARPGQMPSFFLGPGADTVVLHLVRSGRCLFLQDPRMSGFYIRTRESLGYGENRCGIHGMIVKVKENSFHTSYRDSISILPVSSGLVL